jgi:hypothetical protein
MIGGSYVLFNESSVGKVNLRVEEVSYPFFFHFFIFLFPRSGPKRRPSLAFPPACSISLQSSTVLRNDRACVVGPIWFRLFGMGRVIGRYKVSESDFTVKTTLVIR